MTTFIVICRADQIDGQKGPYVLATRRVFVTADEAATYARTINESREPLTVEGRWHQFRLTEPLPVVDAATARAALAVLGRYFTGSASHELLAELEGILDERENDPD